MSESNRATQLFCELEQVKRVANELAEHNRRLTGELEACCDVADHYKGLLEQIGDILGVPAEPHQGRDFIIVERVRELARGTTIPNRNIMTTAGIEVLTRAAQETLIEPTNDIS